MDRPWFPVLTREWQEEDRAKGTFRFSLRRQVHGRSRRTECIRF